MTISQLKGCFQLTDYKLGGSAHRVGTSLRLAGRGIPERLTKAQIFFRVFLNINPGVPGPLRGIHLGDFSTQIRL